MGLRGNKMKIAVNKGKVILAEIEPLQFEQIKRIGLMRWNKSSRSYSAPVSLDLLNELARLFALPREIEAVRQGFVEVRRKVEEQRADPHPKPLCNYPVKANLFEHQIRAANMAMLIFGAVPESEAKK